ncbi:DUF2550 family protein [Janibacter cremeus]|uniref:DUF2550 family protein n=1 Tax=Janibacter cremeus TaxID=1285192 RepID=A0A852VSN9_9MICO|nr:DUF2550 family protein [Janibacter cremeus]NYF97334.1 hypothetical protein [Janibacter cremeus]
MSALQVVEILLLAGCLLLALWLVVLWLRRRALAAHEPVCPCAIQLPGSPRWRLGLLRMGAHHLDWFSVGGLTTSPAMSWAREGLEISTPAPESVSLPGLDAAVAVTLTRGDDHLVDLAVEPKIYPAVRSWLESAPPGHNANVT